MRHTNTNTFSVFAFTSVDRSDQFFNLFFQKLAIFLFQNLFAVFSVFIFRTLFSTLTLFNFSFFNLFRQVSQSIRVYVKFIKLIFGRTVHSTYTILTTRTFYGDLIFQLSASFQLNISQMGVSSFLHPSNCVFFFR